MDKKKINILVRDCKKYLIENKKVSKATLKDLKIVLLANINNDYKEVFGTKLYNLHSVEYCMSLQFFYDALQ